MYNKVVIGIDQSYQCTGISVFADGEKRIIRFIEFNDCSNNSEKRNKLRRILNKVVSSIQPKTKELVVIFERIRHSSSGFVSIKYIKSTGALNSVIIDVCDSYGVEAYSVDTRCWKSQIVGSAKAVNNKFGVDPKKWLTVKWCLSNGWEEDIRIEVKSKRQKGCYEFEGKKYMYVSDASDSAAIASFGFIGDLDKLELEH